MEKYIIDRLNDYEKNLSGIYAGLNKLEYKRKIRQTKKNINNMKRLLKTFDNKL